MSKWHIWDGIFDALQGTTGEGMPEGESGGVGGSGRLSCLLLIHFLLCAATHTPRPPFHGFQYPQNLVSYNGFLGVRSQLRNQGLHHTECEKQEDAVAGTQSRDPGVAGDVGSCGVDMMSGEHKCTWRG